MTRGIKKHSDPPVEVKFNVPSSVINKVDLVLVDPVRGKPKYGARAKLMTKLLRDWLHNVEHGKADPTHYTGGV